MLRQSIGYFSTDQDHEKTSLTQDIEQTNLLSNERVQQSANERQGDAQEKSSSEIYSSLSEDRKKIVVKILQGEKILQRELTRKLNLIALERKRIYQEKFTVLKKPADKKTIIDRQLWQYFANVDGSSFSSKDIVEIQQKSKEIEGELKRSEFRYNIERQLSRRYKKYTAIKPLKHYITSLLNSLRKHNLICKADELELMVKQYDKRSNEKDKEVDEIASEKNKSPNLLKEKKTQKQRKKSIKLLDVSGEVSRPFTFSYFPEITPPSTEEKAEHSQRIPRDRKTRLPKL